MDYADITIALSMLAIFFSIGAILMFFYQVKLGFKKNLFACTMCGNCCRLRIIQITEEDIKRMEKEGLKDFHVKSGNEYWMRRENGRCVYLKDDKCSIHKIRPQICRNFPFFKRFGLEYCRAVSFCPAVEKLRKNA